MAKTFNYGIYNYGNYNYGNYNYGNYNYGDYNYGDYNYGNYNYGNFNYDKKFTIQNNENQMGLLFKLNYNKKKGEIYNEIWSTRSI